MLLILFFCGLVQTVPRPGTVAVCFWTLILIFLLVSVLQVMTAAAVVLCVPAVTQTWLVL